jgi:hypothetical protein
MTITERMSFAKKKKKKLIHGVARCEEEGALNLLPQG